MQKQNRKTAPPGFLTAREAMTLIGVPSTTFYALVREGHVPSVTLPGRKEAVYPVGKVEAYRRTLQAAMSVHLDADQYDFGLTLKEDIPAIRELVASESGGYTHTVPQAVMEAWIRKNPEALYILRKGIDIVGYTSMFPLPLETLTKRLTGEYWNRSIPIDDIQPFAANTPYPLYVAEMVARSDPSAPNPKHTAMRLISEIAKLLARWAKEGVVFHEIYAVGTSEAGINLCHSLGMEPLDLPQGVRADRVPFRLDVDHSTTSRLVQDYRKLLNQ